MRGAGDLATGVAWRLTRAGWPVVALELAEPLTVRRRVALSSAVADGSISVESMTGVLVATADEARRVARRGRVAVLVAPGKHALAELCPDVVVDARLAKRNIDTAIDDAHLVIGLGPGFTAGVDCHAVVETKRGHRLGRVIWDGPAAADTGVPGTVGGRGHQRVLRAPAAGVVRWDAKIGDVVEAGALIGSVSPGQPSPSAELAPTGERPDTGVLSQSARARIRAPFRGVLRGAIRSGTTVAAGLKIGDVDPRCDPSACAEISDKALAVGGGVLEAVLTWRGPLADRALRTRSRN